MPAARIGMEPPGADGLLVDANLLVLLAVGTVNRNRIETFKRTRRYTKSDFDLLVRFLGIFRRHYSVAHVLAEVSDLIDLPGPERLQAREYLKKAISLLEEIEMPSRRATEDPVYEHLGLPDAAIGAVARTKNCCVLTDDLDLYLRLSHDNLSVVNFTHLRAREWGI